MKPFFKSIANVAFLILILPALGLYYLTALASPWLNPFPGWAQVLSLFPGTFGAYVRRAFYKWTLRECGRDAWISFGTLFSHATARIGTKVYIGPFCSLGDVTLEDDVLLGSHVSIMNGAGQHGIERLDIPIRDQPGVWPPITIGKDTWIGDRAIVMADVGKHCVIGAGSLVNKPIPDFAIAIGTPARVVRYRNQTQIDQSEETNSGSHKTAPSP